MTTIPGQRCLWWRSPLVSRIASGLGELQASRESWWSVTLSTSLSASLRGACAMMKRWLPWGCKPAGVPCPRNAPLLALDPSFSAVLGSLQDLHRGDCPALPPGNLRFRLVSV